MQERRWTVEAVSKPMVPDWTISCLDCVDDQKHFFVNRDLPPIVCRDERQANLWAQMHHTTSMTTVQIRWHKDSWPGAMWVYQVFADFIVQAALRLPVGLGVETGHGLSGWATGLYGEPPSVYNGAVLRLLEAAVVDEAVKSRFTFDITWAVVEPMSSDDFLGAKMASSYEHQYVGWK